MTTTAATLTDTFATMVNLEWQVDTNFTLAVYGSDADTRARGEMNLKTTKARLYALMNGLSIDELKAYGEYRRSPAARRTSAA